MGQPDLVILVPVLHRPKNIDPLMESIRVATPHARTVFLSSPDSPAETDALRERNLEVWEMPFASGPGDYARKINYGSTHTDEAFIFLGADDLRFHAGWFEAAAALMTRRVLVVGTNDLGNPRVLAGEHATHSLVARRYVRRGTIDGGEGLLHDGYPHEFVDDEFVGTAKARGVWAFAADAVVEHLHPHWGKADTDFIYAASRSRLRVGRRLWRERCPLWGETPSR